MSVGHNELIDSKIDDRLRRIMEMRNIRSSEVVGEVEEVCLERTAEGTDVFREFEVARFVGEGIEEDEQSGAEARKAEVQQYQMQMQQCEAQLKQATELLMKQKDTVDKAVGLIQENSRLKMLLINLEAEGREKINQANAEIEKGNARIREVEGDARAFAELIAGGGAVPQNQSSIIPQG